MGALASNPQPVEAGAMPGPFPRYQPINSILETGCFHEELYVCEMCGVEGGLHSRQGQPGAV